MATAPGKMSSLPTTGLKILRCISRSEKKPINCQFTALLGPGYKHVSESSGILSGFFTCRAEGIVLLPSKTNTLHPHPYLPANV